MSAPGPDGRAAAGARQLAFEFAPLPRYGQDDFLIAPSNAAAHGLVDAWPGWPDPFSPSSARAAPARAISPPSGRAAPAPCWFPRER